MAEVEVVLLAVVVVDGVGFVGVRRGGCVGWSRVGLPSVLLAPLPGVTLPASPEYLSPLYWGWLWGGRSTACPWTTSVSMVWVIRVFEVVGVTVGRGVGRPGGRCRCRWSWLFVCSMTWFIRWPRFESLWWPVRGRFWCRWGWLFACSMTWAWLLAEDWVVMLAVVGVDGVFHKRVR